MSQVRPGSFEVRLCYSDWCSVLDLVKQYGGRRWKEKSQRLMECHACLGWLCNQFFLALALCIVWGLS